jgi:hypothetical protein
MDCSAVHAIVDASIHARELGRRLVVLRVPPDLDRIWTLIERRDDAEVGDASFLDRPGHVVAA